MAAELNRVMEWYEIALDSQKVMKKLIKKNPEIIPLDSVLAAKEVKETDKLLQRSIGELNDLTIVSLVSIFEQVLIEKLKMVIQSQFDRNDDFSNKLSFFTIQQVERGRFTEIIDLYKPLVGSDLSGTVNKFISIEIGSHMVKRLTKPHQSLILFLHMIDYLNFYL